jgi:hypothetical protein
MVEFDGFGSVHYTSMKRTNDSCPDTHYSCSGDFPLCLCTRDAMATLTALMARTKTVVMTFPAQVFTAALLLQCACTRTTCVTDGPSVHNMTMSGDAETSVLRIVCVKVRRSCTKA